jgi:hypothetical protein
MKKPNPNPGSARFRTINFDRRVLSENHFFSLGIREFQLHRSKMKSDRSRVPPIGVANVFQLHRSVSNQIGNEITPGTTTISPQNYSIQLQ